MTRNFRWEEERTTVINCEVAAEYPIDKMIEGRKRENEYRGVSIPRYALLSTRQFPPLKS